MWNREDSSPSMLGESLSRTMSVTSPSSDPNAQVTAGLGRHCADGELEARKDRNERSTVEALEFRSARSAVVSRVDVRCHVVDSAETPCTGTRVSAST